MLGRVIIIIIVSFILYSFYKKIKQFSTIFKENNNTQRVKQMLKDPQCGTYVSVETNFKLSLKGKHYYFCSIECKEKFLKENN